MTTMQAESPGTAPPVPTTVAPDAEWQKKAEEFRHRQESVAAILESAFGPLGKSNPDLWERRAYLLIVGMLYEKLATNEQEIETEELVSLSKTLADHRRVEHRVREGPATPDETDDAGESGESGADLSGPLPEKINEMVRRVYGANLDAPDRTAAGRDAGPETAHSARGEHAPRIN